ncbi:MAG TPA: AI-2E family transporter [Microvirga sp.]|jgi:predicted PurR-regulated permease PerM|nr:AI-2E family transporter [Microvirga sp.]
MATARVLNAWTALIGVAVGLAALKVAGAVFAPVAFALFLIALLWPLQRWFEARVPRFAALAASIVVLVTAFIAFASLIAWGFGRVGRWIIANLGRFQAFYDRTASWLDEHGIAVAGLWADYFNAGSLLTLMQRFTSQVNTTLSFWVVVLVYVILGLLEVDATARKLKALPNRRIAHLLSAGSAAAAGKFRRYMAVRTLMSVLTGALVWFLATLFGLPLAQEWGVIAFVLNYIPFIGPIIATLFPTLFAVVEFESWEAVVAVLACLYVVQSGVGNYLEPRLAGSALALSPFVLLFSIFLWTFLWGLSGTFIGVPIAVAVLTFCAHHPDTRWVALLFGTPDGWDGQEADRADRPKETMRH